VARHRVRASPLEIVVVALAISIIAVSCLDLSWKEGIACDGAGRCPGDLACCSGSCRRQCAAPDASPPADGPMVVICPAELGGCFGCMPGCACACGTTQTVCCLQFGIATCSATCP
jgi:hypothetical protein